MCCDRCPEVTKSYSGYAPSACSARLGGVVPIASRCHTSKLDAGCTEIQRVCWRINGYRKILLRPMSGIGPRGDSTDVRLRPPIPKNLSQPPIPHDSTGSIRRASEGGYKVWLQVWEDIADKAAFCDIHIPVRRDLSWHQGATTSVDHEKGVSPRCTQSQVSAFG